MEGINKLGAAGLVAVALFVFPLTAIPIYLMGVDVARDLEDRTNGLETFPLILLAAMGLPALASTLLTRLAGAFRWPAAIFVGFCSGLFSAGALILALVLYLQACGPECS
jgi:hypothetical protein